MPEITGDSAEAIALELLMTVARAEGVQLDKDKGGWSKEKILARTGNASPRSEARRGKRRHFGKSVSQAGQSERAPAGRVGSSSSRTTQPRPNPAG